MRSPARLALCCALAARAGAQRGARAGAGAFEQPEPVPIDQAVLSFFDADGDGLVASGEVDAALESIEALASFSAPAGAPNGGKPPPNPMEKLISGARTLAPTLFSLLDADGSGALSAAELSWLATVGDAIGSGLLKNLTRDVFVAIDSDADDVLSADELDAAAQPEPLRYLLALVQERLPTPALAAEGGKSDAELGGKFRQGVALLDSNGDGRIERKEAGRALGTFSRAFRDATGMLSNPMLAMLGGGAGAARGRGAGGAAGRGRGYAGPTDAHPLRPPRTRKTEL